MIIRGNSLAHEQQRNAQFQLLDTLATTRSWTVATPLFSYTADTLHDPNVVSRRTRQKAMDWNPFFFFDWENGEKFNAGTDMLFNLLRSKKETKKIITPSAFRQAHKKHTLAKRVRVRLCCPVRVSLCSQFFF